MRRPGFSCFICPCHIPLVAERGSIRGAVVFGELQGAIREFVILVFLEFRCDGA